MHLTERMFAARFLPWHADETVADGRTILVPEYLTGDEVYRTVFGWQVDLVPVYVKGTVLDANGNPRTAMLPIKGRHAVQRDSDGKVFDVVSEVWEPFQPRDLTDTMDAILNVGGERTLYESAGSLLDNRIWAMARIPETLTIGDDVHCPFCVIATSFDRSMATRIFTTFLRVQCANTLTASWSSKITSFSVKHTTNAGQRIAQAREALNITFRNMDVFQAEADALIEQAVTDAQFHEIVAGLFPHDEDHTKRQRQFVERRRNTVINVWETDAAIQPVRFTGWGAVNAVQTWEQWSTRATTTKVSRSKMADRAMSRMLADQWPKTNETARMLAVARR